MLVCHRIRPIRLYPTLQGLVRVRRNQQWDYIAEDAFFSSAIRCVAFDDSGYAWIGDDAGRVKVRKGGQC